MKPLPLFKQIVPLAVVCSVLLGYQYMGATWSEPIGSAPTNNTEAPINVGAADQVKNGALSVDGLSIFGGALIQSAAPTVEFSDTDNTDWWIHANNNRMYLLADRNDDGVWAGEAPFPMQMFAGATPTQDWVQFSGQVRASEYCDASGSNCGGTGGVAGFETYFVNQYTKTCTQIVSAANIATGDASDGETGFGASVFIQDDNGKWQAEFVRGDCSPMSNRPAARITVPVDGSGNPVASFFTNEGLLP